MFGKHLNKVENLNKPNDGQSDMLIKFKWEWEVVPRSQPMRVETVKPLSANHRKSLGVHVFLCCSRPVRNILY